MHQRKYNQFMKTTVIRIWKRTQGKILKKRKLHNTFGVFENLMYCNIQTMNVLLNVKIKAC